MRNRSALLLITFAVILFWGNTLMNDYALDDKAVITENRFTRQGIRGIPDLVTHEHFYGYNNAVSGLYRPLPLASHALEYELAGASPFTGHLVNLLLYLAGCLLLYLLLIRWLPSYPLAALAAALLFALHPLHTESVANIKGRDDLLNLLFLLLTAYGTIRWVTEKKTLILVLALLCYAMALFSKESAVAFLPVFPLSLWFFSRADRKQITLLSAGLVITAVVYLMIRARFIHDTSEFRILDAYYQHADSRPARLATSTANLLRYFGLLIFPFPLIYDYSYNQIPVIGWMHPRTLISLAITLALIIFALITLPRRNILSFCILGYFLTLSVSANLLTPSSAVFAERFLFLPSLFFSLAFAWLLLRLTSRPKMPPWLFPLILAAILLPTGILTFTRNRHWHDDYTLFTRDLKYMPENARAHYNLASWHYQRIPPANSAGEGMMDENAGKALFYLERTSGIDSLFSDAWLLQGILHYNNGKLPEAIQAYRKTLQAVGQGYTAMLPADTISRFIARAWFRMGVASFSRQQYPQAVSEFRSCLASDPANATAFFNIGACYNNLGRSDSAIWYFRKAAVLDTIFLQTYRRIGIRI